MEAGGLPIVRATVQGFGLCGGRGREESSQVCVNGINVAGLERRKDERVKVLSDLWAGKGSHVFFAKVWDGKGGECHDPVGFLVEKDRREKDVGRKHFLNAELKENLGFPRDKGWNWSISVETTIGERWREHVGGCVGPFYNIWGRLTKGDRSGWWD